MISSVRGPRVSKSCPAASNSGRFHPTPAPRVTRPREMRSRVTRARLVTTGWRSGRMYTLVARRMVVVQAATAPRVTHGSNVGVSGTIGATPSLVPG